MSTLNIVGNYVGSTVIKTVPQQLGAILYLPDLNTPINGYWVDKSGKNKQVQAATTTIANDSLIMPANDADIIAALTLVGAYSKYYTNDLTPKKVLISQIASIDAKYCVFFDAKTKTKFSLFKTQGDEERADKMYEFTFKAYTGGYFPITQTSDSISFVIRGTGTHIFDWGDGTTTSYTLTTTADTTVSKTWTTNLGGQKNISVTGTVKNLTRLVHTSRNTDNNIIRISGMALTYLQLISCPLISITGSISGMALTVLSLYNCPLISITGSISGMALTVLSLYNCPLISITGSISGMALTYLQLVSCPLISITGSISGTALYYLSLYSCPLISITGSISGTALNYLNLYNCPLISITGSISGMALTYLQLISCQLISITGSISGMALDYLRLVSCPLISITGSIETCIVGLTLIEVKLIGIVYGGGATKAWNISQTIQASWTSTMLDAYIIAYASTAPASLAGKVLNWAGTNAAPTSASLTARNSLIAKGASITINS